MPYKYNPISGYLDYYEASAGGTSFVQSGNAFGADAVLGTTDAFGLGFRTGSGGAVRQYIDTIGRMSFNNASTIVTGIGYDYRGTFTTATARFTITSGATTNTSTDISYTSNTVIKEGDFVAGTGIPAASYVQTILSATSARLNNAATATNTGLTFTIDPVTEGVNYLTSVSNATNSNAKPITGIANRFTLTASANSDILSAVDFSGIRFVNGAFTSVRNYLFKMPQVFDLGFSDNIFLARISRIGNANFISFGVGNAPSVTTFNQNIVFGSGNYAAASAPGGDNVIIAKNSCTSASYTGGSNIIIGTNIGQSITSGGNLVLIGQTVGAGITTGTSDVIIGSTTLITGNLTGVTAFGFPTGSGAANHSNSIVLCTNEVIGSGNADTGTSASNQVILGSYSSKDYYFSGSSFSSITLSNYQYPISFNFGRVGASITFTPTGVSFTSGLTTITVTGTGNISNGDSISGTGIQAGTTVTSFVVNTSYTLSLATNATSSGTYTVTKNNIASSARTISFNGPIATGTGIAGDFIFNTSALGLVAGNTVQTLTEAIRIDYKQQLTIGGVTGASRTSWLNIPAAIAGKAHIRLIQAPAITAANDGELVYDGTNLKFNIGGLVQNIQMGGSASTQIPSAFQTVTYGATSTWNFTLGFNAQLSLTGNTILAISNMGDGDSGIINVIQDVIGTRTITLPASSVVVNGGLGAIILTPTSNAQDILTVVKKGSVYYWTQLPNFT